MIRRTLIALSALSFAAATFAAPDAAKPAKPVAKAAPAAATSSIPGYTEADIKAALQAAYDKYKDIQEGKNADYIPALAKVDSNIYGIALVTADGKVYTAGDVKSEVSIQSISKVFTMAKVIEESGPEAIEKRIGVDATGMRFNSIVAVEFAQKALGGPEINPLVNPGAITASTLGTLAVAITCMPVTGFLPPLASVPAIVARSMALTAIAHCSVYTSVACNGFDLMNSYAYIR
jgi:glutaminase